MFNSLPILKKLDIPPMEETSSCNSYRGMNLANGDLLAIYSSHGYVLVTLI